MRKLSTFLFSLLLCLCTMGQEPVITMTSAQVPGSVISLRLNANPNQTIQVDFGDGSKQSYTSPNIIFDITGTLGNSKTIKIYETGANIDGLSCQNNMITSLDVTQCNTLTALVCLNNQLTSLNVSNNTTLTIIECSDNQITMLDLSKNTALESLHCSNNQLEELDLTNNPTLNSLVCTSNRIKKITLHKDCSLSSLRCHYNQLTFATLPYENVDWNYYTYAPQQKINLPPKIYVGDVLDLSSQYSIRGNNTQYKLLYGKNYGVLTLNTDYTNNNGKITFLKSFPDSVCCQMINSSVPDLNSSLILKTTYFKVFEQQAITFNTLPAKKANDAPFTILASASSGLAVTFISSDATIASVSGNTVTIKKAGTVTITASQAGNDLWDAAPSIAQTLTISKLSQTITFNALPAQKANDAPFTLSASASSGLAVTFTSSNSAIASINGTMLTIHAAGNVKITASQAGDNTWEAATAERELTITTVTGINEEKEFQFMVFPNPVTDILYIKGTENTKASIYNLSGIIVWNGVLNQQCINVSELLPGIYILKISGKEKKEVNIRFNKQ